MQSKVDSQGLSGIIPAGQHHSVKKLPDGKHVARNDTCSGPSNLANAWHYFKDLFMLIYPQTLHKFKDWDERHDLGETRYLPLLVFVFGEQDLSCGLV